jgi:diguanylate cyclase (GGDEF)-like protein
MKGNTTATNVLELVERVDKTATRVVARWLAKVEGYRGGEPESLADLGVLAGRVPPSALISAHLMWRGTAIELLEESGRHGVDSVLLEQARIVLAERCDAGLVAASRQFDEPRDRLTGLASRPALLERMEHALRAAARYQDAVGVVFIEVDAGGDPGEELLLQIAERLARVARDSDTVARVDTTEFVICCERLRGDLEAVAIADRTLMALRQPYSVDGDDLQVSATAGIAVSSGGDDPETLLSKAGAARRAALEQ